MGEDLVGWISGPNVRGTSEIIWSCVFVVFLSTWTTLHINVPPVKKGIWWRFRNKCLLMAVGLLAPEYIATIAFTELRSALIVRDCMQRRGYEEWTLAQGFFVAMGGYMACINGQYIPISAENFVNWERSGVIIVLRSPSRTMVKSNPQVTEDDGMEAQKYDTISKLPRARPVESLGAGVELPWISKEDLTARSKADFFLKAIACAQISWLLVQYVGRATQSLANSSLEALSVAYIVCALFSYCAWWKKPYDLEAPTSVTVSPDHDMGIQLRGAPPQIPFNDDPDLPVLHTTLWTYVLPCTAAVLAFSSLHFLAWNSHFNTIAEQWLWRASSIVFVWFHVVFLAFGVHMQLNMKKAPTAANIAKIGNCAEWKVIWYMFRVVKFLCFTKTSARLNQIDASLLRRCDPDLTPKGSLLAFLVAHTFIYFMLRFYVLIEAFMSLRRAPAGLYDTINWTKMVPHVH